MKGHSVLLAEASDVEWLLCWRKALNAIGACGAKSTCALPSRIPSTRWHLGRVQYSPADTRVSQNNRLTDSPIGKMIELGKTQCEECWCLF